MNPLSSLSVHDEFGQRLTTLCELAERPLTLLPKAFWHVEERRRFDSTKDINYIQIEEHFEN